METQFTWAPDSSRLAVLADAADSRFLAPDGTQLGHVTVPDGWQTTFVVGTEWASWSLTGAPSPSRVRVAVQPEARSRVLARGRRRLWVTRGGPGAGGERWLRHVAGVGTGLRHRPGRSVLTLAILSSDGMLLHRVALPGGLYRMSAAW